MTEVAKKEWFELKDVRRRSYSKAVWVPVYGSCHPRSELKYPEVGHIDDLLVVGTAVIFEQHRNQAEKLGWHEFSQDSCGPYVSEDGTYYHAGDFPYGDKNVLGFRLILNQHLNSKHPTQVYIHQDFLLAYGLLREGNIWVRPDRGYEEVIRRTISPDNQSAFIEIRAEYLKDYLAARKAALRLYYFRQRRAVLETDPEFDWPDDNVITDLEHDRCEVRVSAIDETGDIAGATWALFKTWRTDVDEEEDVPDFSQQDDDSTAYESTKGVRRARETRYSVTGEMWRAEWVEPARASNRMGYNEPDEDFYVLLDGGGEKVSLKGLRFEEVGKYLWFKPEVINAVLAHRDSVLAWYTRETGGVSAFPDWTVHFGVNRVGLVNAYAYDIARRPLWERRIWAAHNCRPDGGVSAELLQCQMECEPASTSAPEQLVQKALNWLDDVFKEKFGGEILREHDEISALQDRIHRFRATDEPSLRSIAKDIVKLTIERLDKKSLLAACKGADPKLGTLKLFERLLAEHTDAEHARTRFAPLFGIYDLRLADAHLSKSDIEGCYERIGVDRDLPFVLQASTIMQQVADTIGVTATEIKKHPQSSSMA